MGEIDIDQNLLTFLFLFPFYWGLINQISIFLKMCFDSWILQHCWIRALGWLGNIFHSTIWNQFEKIHKAKKKNRFQKYRWPKNLHPRGRKFGFLIIFWRYSRFFFSFFCVFSFFSFFVCLFVVFLKLKMHILIHRRVSDKNFFIWQISGNQTTLFGLKLRKCKSFVQDYF